MYVQRDANGKIIGRYRQPQPGYAEEFLPDDAPELKPGAEELRREALASLNAAFEAAAAALIADYPPSERLTWPIQEAEARAFVADAKAETPYVDQLAAARGIDRAEIVQRILAKSDTWRSASALLLAERHKGEEAIETAEDQTAIDAAVAAAAEAMGRIATLGWIDRRGRDD